MVGVTVRALRIGDEGGLARLKVLAIDVQSPFALSARLAIAMLATHRPSALRVGWRPRLFRPWPRGGDASSPRAAAIRVTATRSLAASITGTGTIDYRGDPRQVTRRMSGSGTISPG